MPAYDFAVELINNKDLNLVASDEQQLALYGAYKRVESGRCEGEGRPSVFFMRERAKWDAWNSMANYESDEAKLLYVETVLDLLRESGEGELLMQLEELLEKTNLVQSSPRPSADDSSKENSCACNCKEWLKKLKKSFYSTPNQRTVATFAGVALLASLVGTFLRRRKLQ